MKVVIAKYPLFLYLLPVFFVLHGCLVNYDYISFKDALLLTGVYTLSAFTISLLFWLIYRNFTKANLAAFLIMAFHFFFGTTHDTLKKFFGEAFITRYSFILPAAGIFFLLAFIFIKKRKSGFATTRKYLNTLLLLLILADTIFLLSKVFANKKNIADLPTGFSKCDTCQKPDIYFILADEYAGNTELKDIFGFDNKNFLDALTQRKFHVMSETYSNYNYTPFSMASMLDMDYLQLAGRTRNQSDLTYSYDKIRNNKLLRFLQQHNYSFYNYSIFDFEGQPGRKLENFLPVKTRLITSQTFLSRIEKNILFNIVTRFNSHEGLRKTTYANKKNNESIYQLTWDIASKRTANPKFIYTHLEMPHYPYYFDKDGKEQPFEKIVDGNQGNKEFYIEYLQYCNKKFLALIDHIQQSSPTPPIIILMGDHGFRHFSEPVANKYYFLNLSSIYLPSGNYAGFTDSLTSVNFFRTLLNTEFRQQLPMLKDTTIYLND